MTTETEVTQENVDSRATKVCRETKERQERTESLVYLGLQVRRVTLAYLESQEPPESLDHKVAWGPWGCQVGRVQRVAKEELELLGILVLEGQMGLKVRRVTLGCQVLALLDFLEKRAQAASQDSKVFLGPKERRVAKDSRECLDHLDQKETLDELGIQEVQGDLERRVLVGCQEYQGNMAFRDDQVSQVCRVHQEAKGRKVNLVRMGIQDHRGKEVNQVFQAQASRDLQGSLVPKVRKGIPDFQAHLATPASQESKVTKDFQATRANQASRETEACLDPLWKGPKETEEPPGSLEKQVLSVLQVSQEFLAVSVPKGRRETRASRERRETKVSKEKGGCQESLVSLVSQVTME